MAENRINLDFRKDETLAVRLQRISRLLIRQAGNVTDAWFHMTGALVQAKEASDEDIYKAAKLTIVVNDAK